MSSRSKDPKPTSLCCRAPNPAAFRKAPRPAFGDQVMTLVPEMERDVTGLPMIEKLANIMFA